MNESGARIVRKITLKIFNKTLVIRVKFCYHWVARLGKRAKNAKKRKKMYCILAALLVKSFRKRTKRA